MKIYIQILGTETGDSTPGILVFFDQKRYLFNCGEGTQRFCIEHKVRLARVDHIFVTQLSWDYIGGIPGGLLSLYEMGLKNINLFGPKGLKNFLEACRYFFQRPDMTFRIREFEDTDFFQDENLKIIPIILNPQKSDTFSRSSDEKTTFADSESDDVYFTDPEETLKVASSVSFDEKTKFYTMQLTQPLPNVAKKRKISETKNTREWTQSHGEQNDSTSECATPRTCSKDASFLSLVSTILQHRYKNRPFVRMSPRLSPSTQSPSHTVVSYVCHTPTVPGKFNVQKALQLGVPKGPLFGALRRGETVTLDNGTVVRPSDCIEPDVPGAILIVVHCPSIDYLASLCSHSALTPYLRPGDPQQSTGSMNHSNNSQNHWRYVKCVVHITPLGVLTTPAYSKWMNSFEESAHHIVINKEICKQQLIFRSAAIHSIKLNFVHSELFPKPKYTSTPACSINDLFKKDNVPKWVVAAEPLMKFHLCPLSAIGLDVSELLSDFNEQEILQSLQADEQLKNTIKQQQSLIIEAENNPNDEKLIQPQPTIVFLGTGAAMPSKYRNVSAILVDIPQFGSLLLDVGEGTFGQLVRLFGFNNTNTLLMNLKCVFISHIHADHHLGLIRILLKRQEALLKSEVHGDELLIVGPIQLLYWLQEFSEIQSLNFRFCDSRDLLGTAHHTFKYDELSHFLEEQNQTSKKTSHSHCYYYFLLTVLFPNAIAYGVKGIFSFKVWVF